MKEDLPTGFETRPALIHGSFGELDLISRNRACPGNQGALNPKMRLVLLSRLLTVAVFLLPCLTSAQCTVLNQCGLLGEKVYSGSANLPETIQYRAQRIDLGNGVAFDGLRLSFANDVNAGSPYLGVWRIPKGASLQIKLVNMHFTLSANIHLHGLHVKGTGQDDPSLSVSPGSSFTYSIQVGANHGGGTYWMHPHAHPYGIRNIAGCALGMVIVEDDAGDREVPRLIRTAPSFNLIVQRHQPKYWTPQNLTTPEFVTVNGIPGNPALEFAQLKWTRLRILSVGVSFGGIVPGKFTPAPGVSCTIVLIAKDGVYLRSPRYLSGPTFATVWNEASRNDFMIRCDGFVGDEIQFAFGTFNAFRLRLVSRNQGEAPELFNVDYSTCLPSYLADTFNDAVDPNTLFIGPTLRFNGFEQTNAIASFPINSTIQLNLGGFGHPFHLHVNHFQVQTDDSQGWYRRGDWHDAAENVNARMRLSAYTQLMLIHCHNIDHQETFNTNGMMGVIWITGNDQLPTRTFAQECPSVVQLMPSSTFTPTTSQIRTASPTAPTRRVTSSPTKRPTTAPPTQRTKSPTPGGQTPKTSSPNAGQTFSPSTISTSSPSSRSSGSSAPSQTPTRRGPTRRPTVPAPSRSPATSKPSRAPKTSKPSRSPTPDLSCRSHSFNDDACEATGDRCYVFRPAQQDLDSALEKLKPKARTACLKNQLGCRAQTGRFACSYTCLPLCKLDSRCGVFRGRRKQVCRLKKV